MTSEPHSPSTEQQPDAPNTLQEAIRARAMHTIARDRDVRKRSPKQLATVIVLMLVAVFAFLFAVDISVRTMHRIVDLWITIRAKAAQPAPPDVKQPFPVTVEPAAPVEPAPQTPSSSSASSKH